MKHAFLLILCIPVFWGAVYAQDPDSVIASEAAVLTTDSIPIPAAFDSVNPIILKRPVIKLQNKLLNSKADPVSLAVQFKQDKNKDEIFYLIAGMVLVLAFFRYFYSRYFTNMFQVFFNTSLRQSQLTDQLLQAKLPSLLFNLFFVLSAGIYIHLLLMYYRLIDEHNEWIILLSSIAVVGLIYLTKYSTLKFTGWVTGLKEITNTYIFIIFLINKIIGIFLVPFIIILSFSDRFIINIAVVISLMGIGIFLLLRFYRSYSILQNKLKISKFHFILYIAGIELLPLLLIYKGLMVFLSKNL